jgi:alkanesulfonate monooxygenase SsuD/methylene tetrahydromethanopterin reductase-like flavin-dependent oxidoreductase (luciferase family)
MPTKTARPLKVGLFLSVAEGSAGERWNNLKAMAQHAEAAGFDSLWLGDHLIFPGNSGPGEPVLGRWECWSILSSLAAVTSRVELGTFVVCTGFRNPALLAKMADTVEEISGGRLILGLGAGYYEPEFQKFGFPFDHRVGRFEEALQIVHGLLRGGTIDFQGQYYQARDCELHPRGPRHGGPPIMIGAGADRPRGLRLTAQYADYWNISYVNTAEGVASMREAVDAACAKARRDPATLQRTAGALVDLPGSESSQIPAGVRAYRSSRAPAAGTPEELAERLRDFARAGISHVQLWLEPNTMAGIDAFLPVLELLDRG